MTKSMKIAISVALGGAIAACGPTGTAQRCPRTAPGGPGAMDPVEETEMRVRAFLYEFLERRTRLDKESNLAYWRATNASSEEEAEREYARKAELELEWKRLHSDRDRFAQLTSFRESEDLRDPLLRRQVEILYLAFLPNQIGDDLLKEITDRTNEIEKAFNTHRAEFEGRQATDNELREILREATDSARRRAAWEALKQIGPEVADKVRELARLRNRAAAEVGFANYYEMMMAAQEMDPDAVKALFDQAAALTEEPFVAEKAKLDETLAARYGVAAADLRPWHYADPFFQETPQATDVDFDRFYANPDPDAPGGSNLPGLIERFYASAGMDVSAILAASDLYEKPAKEQHAYCTDIDRAGDVRMLLNLKSNERWASTLLHELGHGVYFAYVDRTDLPYLLRDMHIVSTEAIAEMFGGLTKNARWLREMLDVPEDEAAAVAEAAALERRLQMLIFARWSLVMLNFERALYWDPDQDLNALWWDLVERYQKLTRPEGRDAPDWATKIHVATAPVYYHNYLMGEMMSAQVLETIAREIYGGTDPRDVTFVDRPEAGRFLIERIFERGASIRWDALVEDVTGEPLNPRAFVELLR